MKQKITEHLYSVLFVGTLMLAVSLTLHLTGRPEKKPVDPLIRQLSEISSLHPEQPIDRSMLRESLKVFFPNQQVTCDSIIDALIAWRRQNLLADIEASRRPAGISLEQLGALASMYVSFLFVFFVVMVFIYYGAQTLGLYQFIMDQKGRASPWQSLLDAGKVLLNKPSKVERRDALKKILIIKTRAIVKTIFYAVAFSPAYVVAYSFKTNFETDSMLFLVLLGVFTNGVLITFAHKFYSLLSIESRQGYVETAVAKNISRDYHAIGYRQWIAPVKRFPNHVLEHIFIHTRYQYRASIKEQGSIVITGLIIIEMALNIQGHLGYELLKNLLYRNWDAVLIVVFGFFILVKMTETAVDLWTLQENSKYENRDEV